MAEPLILLRLMVEVENAAEAEAEARRVEARIAGFGTVSRHNVEQYWKIPEFWEIALNLYPDGDALAAYERLIGMADAAWTLGEVSEEYEDRWAVWNPAPGAELLTPLARWAHVELLPYGLGEPADPADFLDLDARDP